MDQHDGLRHRFRSDRMIDASFRLPLAFLVANGLTEGSSGLPSLIVQWRVGHRNHSVRRDDRRELRCRGVYPHGRGGQGRQTRRFDAQPATSGLPQSTDIRRPARLVRFVPLAEVIRSSSPPANTGCDGHSGSPARRNPSSYRERSSARQGPSTSLRVETCSAGLSCRSRAIALCACSWRPAIALLAAATRKPG
jgi:hypothetical protein